MKNSETDIVSSEKRSEIMSKIGPRDSEPEKKLRYALHRLGYRFSLHREDLPGTPDIVMPKYDSVVFMHGCFWHRHDCEDGRNVPDTNTEYWEEKFERNVERDQENEHDLEDGGWNVIVVWECEVNEDPVSAAESVIEELGDPL